MKIPLLDSSDSLSTSQKDEEGDGKDGFVETSLDKSTSPFEFDCAVFHHGRPDVEEILHESTELSGSLAVVCCGPPVFVDKVRDQTAKAVLEKTSKAIEYFEEYQSW